MDSSAIIGSARRLRSSASRMIRAVSSMAHRAARCVTPNVVSLLGAPGPSRMNSGTVDSWPSEFARGLLRVSGEAALRDDAADPGLAQRSGAADSSPPGKGGADRPLTRRLGAWGVPPLHWCPSRWGQPKATQGSPKQPKAQHGHRLDAELAPSWYCTGPVLLLSGAELTLYTSSGLVGVLVRH